MSFNLHVGRDEVVLAAEKVVACSIELGEEKERFFIPVEYWSREKYIEEWKRSFKQGFEACRHSALIVSMRNAEYLNFVAVWVLYFEADVVVVQNQIVFLDELVEGFDYNKINSYIGARESFNEDGEKISEWVVPLVDVIDCFQRLN
ncbi:hypothetical protein ACQKPE_05480 [Pseudomonas sp. NPDC089554]|uniref:hypothetical protein n=1 Tax=Pseudomonas sp. NPDC089554 TaxID=3390653 RepID=UPI003D08CC87